MREARQGEVELAAGACLVWAEVCPERGLEKGGRNPATKICAIFECVGARVMQATTPDGQIGGNSEAPYTYKYNKMTYLIAWQRR